MTCTDHLLCQGLGLHCSADLGPKPAKEVTSIWQMKKVRLKEGSCPGRSRIGIPAQGSCHVFISFLYIGALILFFKAPQERKLFL